MNMVLFLERKCNSKKDSRGKKIKRASEDKLKGTMEPARKKPNLKSVDGILQTSAASQPSK